MDKNRLIAILVLVFIAFAIVFYILWIFVINKGTVAFKADPPYTVIIGPETKYCETEICEIKLPTAGYNYVVLKDGYYEEDGFVEIERWGTVEVGVELEYMVTLLEGKEYILFSLPVGYGKYIEKLLDITLFNEIEENYTLTRLPKKIDNMIFNKSGDKAIVIEADEVSIYSTETSKMSVVEGLEGISNATFSSDESKIYTVMFDEEANKDALKAIYLEEDKEIESLIYLLRDVEEYEMSVSPDDKYIAIIDKTFLPEILYIIDLENASRKNIFEGYLIEPGNWSDDGDTFIFEGKDVDDNLSSMWYFATGSEKAAQLPFLSSYRNIDFGNNGFIYFMTTQKYEYLSTGNQNEVGFVESIETSNQDIVTAEDLFQEVEEEDRSLLLAKMDLQNMIFYYVDDLTDELERLPDKMEINEAGTLARLLYSNQYFDIQLKE